MKEENKRDNKKRRSTFAVLFYLNRAKVKKNGLCPVMGRITIDTQVAQFSAKTDADPQAWDAKTGRATGKSRQSLEINRTLGCLEQKIIEYYTEIVDGQGYVTAELVKNGLNGIGRKADQLLQLFAEHNEEFKLRIGVNRVKATYNLYLLSLRHLQSFIKQKYDTEDIPLRQLNLNFIDAFDFYLRVDRRMKPHTVSGHIITLKKMTRRAVNQGTLKRDPFGSYLAEQPEKLCRHLKSEEIERIMQVHIESKAVCHTRDMFVFSTFTGLAYVDMCNLSEKHLRIESDGSWWICINRQKTGSESNIRLLDIPKQIIGKYCHERKNSKLFKMITLSCICNNLRKIEKLCDIEHVTFHMARHNFGTHITLSQGVPIETVSKMMGHQSIATTQLYAKITNQKVNEDMKLLSTRLTNKYTVFQDEDMPVGIKLNQNFRSNKHINNNNTENQQLCKEKKQQLATKE